MLKIKLAQVNLTNRAALGFGPGSAWRKKPEKCCKLNSNPHSVHKHQRSTYLKQRLTHNFNDLNIFKDNNAKPEWHEIGMSIEQTFYSNELHYTDVCVCVLYFF